jgi:hypothetical protein
MSSALVGLDENGPERARLWIVVGFFLVLGLVWIVYPRVYQHYHPIPSWPGDVEDSQISHSKLCFFLVALVAALGILQLRFRRWFQRDASRFLFRVFLLFGLAMAFDFWTFSVATRFWTLTVQMQSDQARRVYETSGLLARYCLKCTVATGLLNVGFAMFRKRTP